MTRGLPSRIVLWGGLPPDVLATVAAAARARDIPISVYDQITAHDPERRDPSPLRSIAPSPTLILGDEREYMPEMRPGDLWFGAIKIRDAAASRCTTPTSFRRSSAAPPPHRRSRLPAR